MQRGKSTCLPLQTGYLFLRRQALPNRLQWGAQMKQARYLCTSIYKQTINKIVHQIVAKAKKRYVKDYTR
jgi:hypothetical protein